MREDRTQPLSGPLPDEGVEPGYRYVIQPRARGRLLILKSPRQ